MADQEADAFGFEELEDTDLDNVDLGWSYIGEQVSLEGEHDTNFASRSLLKGDTFCLCISVKLPSASQGAAHSSLPSVAPQHPGLEQEIDDLLDHEVVKGILHQGCEVEEYAMEVEKKLRAVELDSIQDYILESDTLVELHDQARLCDSIACAGYRTLPESHLRKIALTPADPELRFDPGGDGRGAWRIPEGPRHHQQRDQTPAGAIPQHEPQT